MRHALAFAILGAALAWSCARLAAEARGAWWGLVAVEAYGAVCLLTLAALYTLRLAGFPVEGALRRAWLRGIVFPYTALAGLVMGLVRRFDPEPAMNQVAPGLSIGRVPSARERARLAEAGIDAVLNLCAEFPGARPSADLDLVVAEVPILDGVAPTVRQFREAVGWVASEREAGRSVLIHCAQGHSRSATIAAAVLCERGLAADADAALAIVRAARPRAKPSRDQRDALARFLSRA